MSANTAELPRVLGLGQVVAIVLGTVIGSGIFIVPATVAGQMGSPALIFAVWVTGGVASFLGALCFAELGAAFPGPGGIYIYLREAYGRLPAFLFGWTLFLVIDSGAIATLAVAFASKYLTFFLLGLAVWEVKAVAVALIAVLAVINCLGVERGAAVQTVLTMLKFGAIVGVVVLVFALAPGSAAHFTEPAADLGAPGLLGRFGVALVASLWAYKGWEVASYSAGEVRQPERTLPLGLILGTGTVVALYLAANLAYLYVFPASELAGSPRIAADAMKAAVGASGAAVIACVILCSIAGAANGNVLTAPRVFYAMAKDGLFFAPFGRLHPRFLAPQVAIAATACWAAVLSLTGTFEQLAAWVVFGQWLFLGLTAAAVVVLRRKRPELTRPYRTWGYPMTPGLFVLAALFIAGSALLAHPLNALAGLGLIAAGVPAFFFWKRA